MATPLDHQIHEAESIIRAFESDIENPHRTQAAIEAKEQQIKKLQNDILEMYASWERLPELLAAKRAQLKELKRQRDSENNKALKEFLRLKAQLEKMGENLGL